MDRSFLHQLIHTGIPNLIQLFSSPPNSTKLISLKLAVATNAFINIAINIINITITVIINIAINITINTLIDIITYTAIDVPFL